MVTVSRFDLIGDYVGHSAIKTRTLLENNIGKVVIIDDILVFNELDMFGKEAVAVLRKFLEEHPSEITVVFTEIPPGSDPGRLSALRLEEQLIKLNIWRRA